MKQACESQVRMRPFHCVHMQRMEANFESHTLEMLQRQFSHVRGSVAGNVLWKMCVQRAFRQNLHGNFGKRNVKYADIFTLTGRVNGITAPVTMFKKPFQPDRWHRGRIAVEMFIDYLENCSCPATALLQYRSWKYKILTNESHKTRCAM